MISLGQHEPTEGYCQTWAGIRIEEGHHERHRSCRHQCRAACSIFRARSARGNWTAALYVDERASIYAVKALTRIFTGKAGGSTGLLKILVGSFLGVRTETIIYEIKDEHAHLPDPEDHRRRGEADRAARTRANVVIRNSGYWVGPDVTVARAETSRVRAFGRNWNFAGRSAELVRLDWGSDAR